MGRDWLRHIHLNWKEIGVAMLDSTQLQLKAFLEKYGDVFRDQLGTMTSIREEVSVKDDASPRFHRPHPMPFTMKEAVEREIHEAGILKKISQ